MNAATIQNNKIEAVIQKEKLKFFTPLFNSYYNQFAGRKHRNKNYSAIQGLQIKPVGSFSFIQDLVT